MNELCRDIKMKLPDSIWQLTPVERYRQGARYNDDFAAMGDKTYVFGVIEVPLAYAPGDAFTWGCWIEVDRALHDAYLAAYQSDAADTLTGRGVLANDIPGYADAEGAPVAVTFAAARRPIFVVDQTSLLGRTQAEGLSLEDHEALDKILFGDDEDFDDEDFDEQID